MTLAPAGKVIEKLSVCIAGYYFIKPATAFTFAPTFGVAASDFSFDPYLTFL